jgi:hypothetical protein
MTYILVGKIAILLLLPDMFYYLTRISYFDKDYFEYYLKTTI